MPLRSAEIAMKFQRGRLHRGYHSKVQMDKQRAVEEAQAILISKLKDKSGG